MPFLTIDSMMPHKKPTIRPKKPARPANLWPHAPKSPGINPRKAKPPIIQASTTVFMNKVIENATSDPKTAPRTPSSSQARTSLFNRLFTYFLAKLFKQNIFVHHTKVSLAVSSYRNSSSFSFLCSNNQCVWYLS